MHILIIFIMLAFTSILFLTETFQLIMMNALKSNLVSSIVYVTVAGPYSIQYYGSALSELFPIVEHMTDSFEILNRSS